LITEEQFDRDIDERMKGMRIWFDTEFIEDGKTIDLLSIGMVRDDGATLYWEADWTDHSRASPWVQQNVIPHLVGGSWAIGRDAMRESIIRFAGDKPQFWAYYGAYDWVSLCQIYGTMMDLPKGWPMYCRDVKQLCDDLGNPKLPEQASTEHHALSDAKWTRQAYEFLQNESAISPGLDSAIQDELDRPPASIMEEGK
jgi:hypothetical protein